MKLGTRGQYAVLALVDLTRHQEDRPIALGDIAVRQHISQQYLEQLFSKLRRKGLVQSVRGQNGGYFLGRSASEISIVQVIDAIDEPIRSTRCVALKSNGCQGTKTRCLTHHLWDGLDTVIRSYLSTITLFDIVNRSQKEEVHG